MSTQDVLNAVKTILGDLSFDNAPDPAGIWTHPADSASVDPNTYPFVIISKLNFEQGSWNIESFGCGRHNWFVLVAVYLHDGPVVVTNTDEITVAAMTHADEWYEAMAAVLSDNLQLNNTVDFIGDGEGKLYDYITDNIIWEGKQHYGHLFMIPVTQTVIQQFSS